MLRFAVSFCLFAGFLNAAGNDSQFLTTSSDVTFSGTRVLLSATVKGGQWVYLHSTGRYGPSSSGPLAYAFITVDGTTVSNDSTINWAGSTDQEQHAFECLAAANLSPGTHSVQLVAVGSSAIYVGAGSSLSILTTPAARVVPASLTSDSPVISVNTNGIQEGTPLPFINVLQTSIVADGITPIVALASGRSYYAGSNGNNQGDAMWNMSIDGAGEQNGSENWSDNDICYCAEIQAPMYNQALFGPPVPSAGSHAISLEATNEPHSPGNDTVLYRVGATTTLVLMNGNLEVYGKAAPNTQVNTRFPYVCVGTSSGWPGCPSTGADVVLASGSFSIPSGHNGVVFFSGSTRVQGDSSDTGGTTNLWLTIDGSVVGSGGVQQLSSPDSVSTRTLTTSYLAAGAKALLVGTHTIQLHGSATGSFEHLSMTQDLPLLWFD